MLAISSAEDFHAAVAAATEKPLVACFSAPWCGGCKIVAPKVEALAEELAATVSFAKVSAEELETLCEEVEVDSFPHFRVYKEGKILGDYTSSKFDKVDAFIRGLVAPETVKTEETPEEETSKESEAKTEGSKKRQEREETETNDEHVAKKVKEAPKETEEVEKVEEASEGAEKVDEVATEKEEVAEDEKEAEKNETAPVDKLETSEATEADAAPVDAAAA